MVLSECIRKKAEGSKIGSRLLNDAHYQVMARAVLSLMFNLIFAFYNGILGVLSSSAIFLASALYYLALCIMRFAIVVRRWTGRRRTPRQTVAVIGILLIFLSLIFSAMVFLSMKDQTAAVYGTIPMITIATFTFTKITLAAITAVKRRKDPDPFYKAANAIRYSEVAVSLLTMQQSMLVSFGEGYDASAVILNACTGAAVCFFILWLGILTFQKRKEL